MFELWSRGAPKWYLQSRRGLSEMRGALIVLLVGLLVLGPTGVALATEVSAEATSTTEVSETASIAVATETAELVQEVVATVETETPPPSEEDTVPPPSEEETVPAEPEEEGPVWGIIPMGATNLVTETDGPAVWHFQVRNPDGDTINAKLIAVFRGVGEMTVGPLQPNADGSVDFAITLSAGDTLRYADADVGTETLHSGVELVFLGAERFGPADSEQAPEETAMPIPTTQSDDELPYTGADGRTFAALIAVCAALGLSLRRFGLE